MLCSVTSVVSLFTTLWTVAHQAPLSVDSPGKNTGVGCHALLQGIFLIQGLNPCLLRLLRPRQILYCWATRDAQLHYYWIVRKKWLHVVNRVNLVFCIVSLYWFLTFLNFPGWELNLNKVELFDFSSKQLWWHNSYLFFLPRIFHFRNQPSYLDSLNMLK